MACARENQVSSPEEVFQTIRLDFFHGHLLQAQQEAEKSSQRFSLSNPEWGWKFRLLQGEILIWRGLNQGTLSLLAPQLPPNLATNDLPIKKYVLESLAHAALGDFTAADQSLVQAETLSATSETELKAEVRTARGILEVRQGRPDRAEQFFREALQLARTHGQSFVAASALLNLSFAAVHQRHYDEAIDWSNKASQLARSIDSGILEEKALGNLGWCYYQIGDLHQSLSLSLEAEKRASALGIVKDQVRWTYNSGAVYDAQYQFPLAQAYYQKALGPAKDIGDLEQASYALSSLSSLSIKLKRFDLAAQYARETFELAHRRGDRFAELYSLLTDGQIAANARQHREAERAFLEVVKDPQTQPPLRWMAQNELAHLYERESGMGSAEKQYQAALSTLECARSSVGLEEFRLSFLTHAADIYDDYIHFLVEHGKSAAALQTAEYSRAQTLAEGLGLLKRQKECAWRGHTMVSPQDAAHKVGGVVLFYWLGQRQSYLWVATAQRTTLVQLRPAAEIESLLQDYRKALLEAPDVLQSHNPDGEMLYDALVAPAQKLIPAHSRVTILADGSLNNLNFETLIVPGREPHYWIEDVTVTNASSLRMLAASQPASGKTAGKLLLIGEPVVPDPKFPPLPNAQAEMQDIEKHFAPPFRQVSSGREANPDMFFKSKPEQFSYVHFVAHGTASQLSPLDSAVILSKATAEEDSYKLHARDIMNHRLHADLVVISTCYGSGTTLYNGEGLVGLSWAFVRAGAHHVIGALWQVNDRSTPLLMDRFYAEIQKGRSPADALRLAKLDLLRSNSSFRKPIYWAPFQFYVGS